MTSEQLIALAVDRESYGAMTCDCSTIDRILADNDPANGTFAARIITMTEGRCNGCGGDRR